MLSWSPRDAPGLQDTVGRYVRVTPLIPERDADALFTAIDKDQDAAITRRELQRYLAKLGTPEEVCAAEASRLFKAIDRDDDGLIDRKEFKAAHRRIACLPHSMA